MGRVYSASFDNVTVSAAQDLWELTATANAELILHGLIIAQSSDYGDAQAEGLRITIKRGATSSGSGGSTPIPAPLQGTVASTMTTVEANNTTPASGGTIVTLLSDAFNIQAGYQLWLPPEMRFLIPISTRVVVNLPAAPADAVSMSSTIFWEEI